LLACAEPEITVADRNAQTATADVEQAALLAQDTQPPHGTGTAAGDEASPLTLCARARAHALRQAWRAHAILTILVLAAVAAAAARRECGWRHANDGAWSTQREAAQEWSGYLVAGHLG
jgi:hypothetical protein